MEEILNIFHWYTYKYNLIKDIIVVERRFPTGQRVKFSVSLLSRFELTNLLRYIETDGKGNVISKI